MAQSEAIRILYIEDDPGLARLVQKRLGRAGYAVDIAADGEEGIAKYNNGGSYDLVFVDQTLPRYDGLQVIRTLAARGPLPPIIMITGTGDETVAVEAMKLGTSDYIVKDVDGGYLSLLPSVIQKVLQQQRAIEEKQEAEAALKREQEKFQALVEQSPLAISMTGKDGQVLYINPTFAQIFGYTLADIPTKRVWFATAYPDETYREQVIATWVKDQKKIKRGEPLARTFMVTCKDGSRKMILFRPITMANGDQFITYEDITDRVRAEESLRESGDKLEKLHDVARRLAVCAGEEEVYRVAVEAAKGIVTFSFCSLGMMEGKEIVTKVIDPSPSPDEPRTMLADAGSAIKASGNAQARGLEEIGKGVHAQPQAHYLSLINVPIGDLGVFQVASLEPDAFSKNDTRLLELLFGHTAAAIKRIRLQTELKEQTIHDPLTGLHNRFYLTTVLDQEIKRSKRYHHGMTFIMIDINRFKEINDSYGHQIGDEVLRGVAALLREAVRESDIVVRYGGDEFLIVLLATTGNVNRIKERIAQKVPHLTMHSGHLTFPVTLSIGSASWDPKGRQSVDEILNKADKKMYDNKKKHNGHAHGGNHA